MEIKAEDYQIELTHDELWRLVFYVRDSLYATFKSHWINHQDSWKKNEKQRLHLLNQMYLSLGRPDLFESVEKEAEKIFLEYNKKRGSAK